MTAFLKEYQPKEIDYVSTESAREYLKLIILREEITKLLNTKQHNLTEEDRIETFKIIKSLHSIPETVPVKDAVDIMGITPQRVRTLCAEGALKATQTLPGSGKWRIETSQLVQYPGWNDFVEKRAEIKNQSKKIAYFMGDNLEILNKD